MADLLTVLKNARAQIALLGGTEDEVNKAHLAELDEAIATLPAQPPPPEHPIGNPVKAFAERQARRVMLAQVAGCVAGGMSGRGHSRTWVAQEAKGVAEAILLEVGL